jgi:hypothetical protein
MTSNAQSKSPAGNTTFESLFVALRRQEGDARISELVEILKLNGHAKETIVGHVMQAVGVNAAARVQRLVSQRAQHMATGTWQRYRMTRTRRVRLWLRNVQESADEALHRLRMAVGRS